MTDLRIPFIDTLIELAEQDRNIVLIVPDVGFKHADKFEERFPDRYINTGVTEQSTMIIAAGLALAGMKPYVYTMVNFIVFRPFEMVRNAIGYHNANVKLIGVSGNGGYGFLGFSHNFVENEDIDTLLHVPNLSKFTPETPEEVEMIIRHTHGTPGPVYIRL